MAAVSSASLEESLGTAPGGEDQRVILNGMSWKDFEVLQALRGDGAGVRMYYLAGRVELMSPSEGHEGLKTMLARLLEAWADHHEIELNGFGSWTLKSLPEEVSAEPDECYVLDAPRKDLPDLALEVAWTRGGLKKLDIYRALGVVEVWMIDKRHEVVVFALRGDGYQRIARSELLPALDLVWLASFLGAPSQSQAVRRLRAAMAADDATRKR
jgi:Uma2 family endonuclease